jgi:hypothetical protein
MPGAIIPSEKPAGANPSACVNDPADRGGMTLPSDESIQMPASRN